MRRKKVGAWTNEAEKEDGTKSGVFMLYRGKEVSHIPAPCAFVKHFSWRKDPSCHASRISPGEKPNAIAFDGGAKVKRDDADLKSKLPLQTGHLVGWLAIIAASPTAPPEPGNRTPSQQRMVGKSAMPPHCGRHVVSPCRVLGKTCMDWSWGHSVESESGWHALATVPN